MTDQRLLLFGIDAATLDLIRPWIERGDLPTLAGLAQGGAVGRLRSVPNMITPAAWTSFATGCNPGKHGVFYFTERIPGSYDERFIKGAARALPPFWMLLSKAGVRATVLNVPMTYPADAVQGVMVAGMDAPSVNAPGFTHPPELADELLQRFGDLLGPGSLSGAIGHLMLSGNLDAALELLERRVERRTSLARFLMERYPAELFVLVHTEVDGVQHYFWKYLDPRLPGFSAEGARRYGTSILRLYQKVDRSLDILLQVFGPAKVMVISDHGAGPSPGPEDGVPWIRLVLEDLGLSVRRSERNALRRTAARATAAAYRAVNPRLPGPLRGLIRRSLPSVAQMAKGSVRYRYDWPRTRAFCLGAAGDVWLNVRGRDPEGVVEPGAEFEQVRNAIRDAFMSLRDTKTGEPVVESVQFREEAYQGPFLERAPDLIIRFRDTVVTALVRNGKSLRLPRRTAATPKEVKSGSHRPDGLIMVAGPGVVRGTELTGAHLMDVAPTILHWMGQPVPSHMDGRVLTEAFAPDYLAARPVERLSIAMETRSGEDTGYSAEDAAVVMERLRGLGYI